MMPDQSAPPMPPEMPAEEMGEQEQTFQCPNCGATLKLEAEQAAQAPATEMPAPSLRDTLSQAMGGGQ